MPASHRQGEDQVSAPASEGSVRRRGVLTVLAVFCALLAFAPMSAYGDSGDDGVAGDATAETAATNDLFTVTSADAAKLHAAKPAKVKEVKVCQRVVPTGSIMAVKSCRTQKEWDELSAKGQDTVRQVRDRSASTLGAGSGN